GGHHRRQRDSCPEAAVARASRTPGAREASRTWRSIVNDDPRVNELLAPLRRDSSELEAVRPTIDRDRVLARMAGAAKSAPLEHARRTKAFIALGLAAAVAATLGLGALRSRAMRTTEVRALDVTAVSGQVVVQRGAAQGIARGRSVRLAP